MLFQQCRRGARGQTFRMLKFRTMVDGAHDQLAELADLNVHASHGDSRLFKADRDPRVTRVGRVLRRFALDELPQVVNVVRGEMSLVGPRPLMLEEDAHVPRWARGRLVVRPGVTGLWQVLGRNEIPFHEMLLLDSVYARAKTVRLDLSLLARTPRAILATRRGH
jgi:lipopolysaccharide/colanic/teichoic acid biosynthesis glycosyltransferase